MQASVPQCENSLKTKPYFNQTCTNKRGNPNQTKLSLYLCQPNQNQTNLTFHPNQTETECLPVVEASCWNGLKTIRVVN